MISKIIRVTQLCVRTVYFRLCGAFKGINSNGGPLDISLSSHIYGKDGGYVNLGSGVKINRNVTIVAVGGNIDIGNKCFLAGNCVMVAHENIIVGENCMFGPGVTVYDHDHIFDSTGVLSKGYKSGRVCIGNKCWIGANAIILRGTQIGDGCIIGAGTVVKGMIPPHSIVTNNREMIIRPIHDSKGINDENKESNM